MKTWIFRKQEAGLRPARWLVTVSCLLLAACSNFPLTAPGPTPATPSPTPTQTPTFTQTPILLTPTYDPNLPVWQNFPAPRFTPVTPIPRPLTGLNIPDEVQVGVLLGNDVDSPFIGRMDAIVLVFYHTRFGRASLLSLPPDLFVYIPGYSMQRLQISYALGGIRQLDNTLEYNLGVKPQQWAMINTNDFVKFVDEMGGLNVPVLTGYPDQCGGINAGTDHLDGSQVLCYIRLREGSNETDRNIRQQEVVSLLLDRMVSAGHLAELPTLFNEYKDSIQTSLSIQDFSNYIPLALKLGDPKRIGFFHLDQSDLNTWQVPNTSNTSVFLPKRKNLLSIVQQAINFVLTPAPLSEIVITLQYELTVSPTPGFTPKPGSKQNPRSTPLPAQTKIPTAVFQPIPSNTP
ncbi:MAG TPA: LCP family protein [Anaerolineaceae bacterium]|nr:LCP family protein [Anaerolineaceae bacterium]